MTKKKNIIDRQWLTQFAGDAFADVGGLVIEYLWHLPKYKDKSILELIEMVAHIYVDDWKAKLHPFFLNSSITQPAYDNQRKIDETIKYFSSLIDESEIHQKTGFCPLSGRKTIVFRAGRDNHILSGSWSYVNFNPGFQSGIFLSKEMLIRMFFVPLGVHRLADKICLIYSNNLKVNQFFVFQNCIKNLSSIENNKSEGPLKSVFNNPATALFAFADDYTTYLKNELNKEGESNFNKDTLLHLYHWSNLGQKPEIVHYSLDRDVFKFYSFCQENYPEEWQPFISYHASPANLKKYYFDEAQNKWMLKEGKEVSFEDYAKWKNLILHNLFYKLSILHYILKYVQHRTFPHQIIDHYEIYIRGMKKEALPVITAIADFIVRQDTEFIDKAVKALNAAAYRSDLSKYLLKISEIGSAKHDMPFTMDQYANYLFPENEYAGYWKEVRNLILIGIYQNNNKK